MDFHTSNTESRTGWDHLSAKIVGRFCAQSRECTAIQGDPGPRCDLVRKNDPEGTSSVVFPESGHQQQS